MAAEDRELAWHSWQLLAQNVALGDILHYKYLHDAPHPTPDFLKHSTSWKERANNNKSERLQRGRMFMTKEAI